MQNYATPLRVPVLISQDGRGKLFCRITRDKQMGQAHVAIELHSDYMLVVAQINQKRAALWKICEQYIINEQIKEY